jgi:hypothetical protein
MTKQDLYLEFKKETGDYPSNNQEYIEWLENKLINLSVKFTVNGKILTSIIKQKNKEK